MSLRFYIEQISDRINTFFDSFGFEKIHMVEVESAEEKKRIDIDNPSSSLASKQVATRPSTQGETLKESQKSLKKSALPNMLKGLKDIELMDIQDAQKALSSFNDVEKEYLFLASYPARVSKYSLEHFESARNAALSYNWLKRNKPLCSLHESGDLLLNEDLRIATHVHCMLIKPQSYLKNGVLLPLCLILFMIVFLMMRVTGFL